MKHFLCVSRRGVQDQKEHLAELRRFRLAKEQEYGVKDKGTGKKENPVLGEVGQREDLLSEIFAKVNKIWLNFG